MQDIQIPQYPDWSSWWSGSPGPRSSCTRGSTAARRMTHHVQEPSLTFPHQQSGQRMGCNEDGPWLPNRRELPKLFYLLLTFINRKWNYLLLIVNFTNPFGYLIGLGSTKTPDHECLISNNKVLECSTKSSAPASMKNPFLTLCLKTNLSRNVSCPNWL